MNLPQAIGRVAGAEAAGVTTRLVGAAVELSTSPGNVRTIASLRDGRVILKLQV